MPTGWLSPPSAIAFSEATLLLDPVEPPRNCGRRCRSAGLPRGPGVISFDACQSPAVALVTTAFAIFFVKNATPLRGTDGADEFVLFHFFRLRSGMILDSIMPDRIAGNGSRVSLSL